MFIFIEVEIVGRELLGKILLSRALINDDTKIIISDRNKIKKLILNNKIKNSILIIKDINPRDLPFFSWCWVHREKYDHMLGSRRSDPTINKAPKLRKILSLGLNIMIAILFNYMGTDTHGPKFVNMKKIKKIVKKVKSRRGQFDTELLIRLSRGGFKIAEAPIEHYETRKNKFPIFKKVSWNIFALLKMYFFLKDLKWKKKIFFNQFCREDVLKIYKKKLRLK